MKHFIFLLNIYYSDETIYVTIDGNALIKK